MLPLGVQQPGTASRHGPGPAGGGVLLTIAVMLLALGCGVRGSNNGLQANFALAVRPASGDAARVLHNAHYYRLMGRPELALQELEDAHRQNPGNLKLANTLAQLYDELGQGERARQIYREALKVDSDHPGLRNNLCFSYYLSGKWKEAEAGFRQTLERQPANAAARNNLGLLLCRQGRLEEARSLWAASEGRDAARQKLEQAMAALGMAGAGQVAMMPRTPLRIAPATPRPSLGSREATDRMGSQTSGAAGPKSRGNKELIRVAAVTSNQAGAPEGRGGGLPGRSHSGTGTADLPPRQNPGVTPPPGETPAPQPAAIPQASGNPAPVRVKVAPQPATVKASSPSPSAPAMASHGNKLRLPRLTARDLIETNIEVRNGNGIPNLAREARSLLSLEGFQVVSIANHVDFGMEKTTILYRAEAEKIAQVLQQKFFRQAEVRPAARLAEGIDVKVILGHELASPGQMMARHAREKQAM